jgi:hypothetical protein
MACRRRLSTRLVELVEEELRREVRPIGPLKGMEARIERESLEEFVIEQWLKAMSPPR